MMTTIRREATATAPSGEVLAAHLRLEVRSSSKTVQGQALKQYLQAHKPAATPSWVVRKRKAKEEAQARAAQIHVMAVAGIRGTSTPSAPVMTPDEQRAATKVKIVEATAAKIARLQSPAHKAKVAASEGRAQRAAQRAAAESGSTGQWSDSQEINHMWRWHDWRQRAAWSSPGLEHLHLNF